MCLPRNAGQGIRWCLSVIHNQAINSKRRYVRWGRELLLMNESAEEQTEWGASLPCEKSSKVLSEGDMALWIRTLPPMERQVLYGLYILDLTQSEIACHLNISQQQVSRLKDRAITKLRDELTLL